MQSDDRTTPTDGVSATKRPERDWSTPTDGVSATKRPERDWSTPTDGVSATKRPERDWLTHRESPTQSEPEKLSPTDKLEDPFEQWWTTYPHREGKKGYKQKCLSKYRKLVSRHGFTTEQLLANLMAYSRYCDETGTTDTQYVMTTDSYLNNSDNLTNPWTVNHEARQRAYGRLDPIDQWQQANADVLNCPSQQTAGYTPKLIAGLFGTMTGLYGAKWTKEHGLADRTGAWLDTLQHLNPQLIAIGVRRCQREKDWPPSAPEFLRLCQPTPEECGLPSVAKAWQEANEHAGSPNHHPWSHRAVYLAGRAAGWFEMRSAATPQDQRDAKVRFANAYGALVEKVVLGQPIEAQLAIEYRYDPGAHSDQLLRETMRAQNIDPLDTQGARTRLKELFG